MCADGRWNDTASRQHSPETQNDFKQDFIFHQPVYKVCAWLIYLMKAQSEVAFGLDYLGLISPTIEGVHYADIAATSAMDESDLLNDPVLSDLLEWDKDPGSNSFQETNILSQALPSFELLERGTENGRAAAADTNDSEDNFDLMSSFVNNHMSSNPLEFHPLGIQATATSDSKQMISNKSSNKTQQQNDKGSVGNLPPFELFGAPIELRTSFIQAQRAMGLPVLHDTNTEHFGAVVNGFHPQYHSNIQFIDNRTTSTQCKRQRAFREQRRSQRVSSLIDELKVKMARENWKINDDTNRRRDNKFQTLSS